MSLKVTVPWSRAKLIPPSDHIQSHKYAKEKPFIPCYDKPQNAHVNMWYLLSWEYARCWQCEVSQFLCRRKCREDKKNRKVKRPKIKPKKKPEPKNEKNKKNKVECRVDHKNTSMKDKSTKGGNNGIGVTGDGVQVLCCC